MIPQRAEILPRSICSNEQAPLGKGIFLPLDTGNHLLGIKELPKPLNAVSGDIRDQWAYMAHLTAARYPYETLVSPFARGSIIGSRDGYSAFDFSILSGARRKNATRETTSPLKAWLHEHRKNPYPTKGEKIMLAILTKMTLTQISTWFANARRRLKKDNKMTWSPRNKSSDKRESICKSSRKDDTGKSISSIDDDDDDFSECMDTNERDPKHSCSKDLSKFDDLDMNDDVFTDDGKSLCGDENPLKEQRPTTKLHENDSKLRPKGSSEGILKKIDFAGNNSPVGNLQRWVDGHFGNQSPYDFPRELTPPRTPVEEVISPVAFISKEMIKHKEQPLPVRSEHEIVKSTEMVSSCEEREKVIERKQETKNRQYPTTPSSLPEEYVRSVASNENGLQGQFRSCGLTSHREIDAVLALTSLASR